MLGGFSKSLAETIARADGNNAAKLALVFPAEVVGIKSFQEIDGWWEDVLSKVQNP